MKARNFVAKNAHLASRSGPHGDKFGKNVKRAIARSLVRKQLKDELA